MFLVQTRGYKGTHSTGFQAFTTLKSAVEYMICVYVGVYTNKNVLLTKHTTYWARTDLDATTRFSRWCSQTFKVTEVPVDDGVSASKAINASKILGIVEAHGMKV